MAQGPWRRRRRTERLITVSAAFLLAVAVAGLALASTGGGGTTDDPPGGSRGRAATPRVGPVARAYPGGSAAAQGTLPRDHRPQIWVSRSPACDDARSAELAGAESTPLCTLTRALTVARPGVQITLTPGGYGPLAIPAGSPASRDVRIVAQRPQAASIEGGLVTQAQRLGLYGLRNTKTLLVQRSRRLVFARMDFDGGELWLRQDAHSLIVRSRFHDFHPSLDRALLIFGNEYHADQPNTVDVTVRSNVFERLDHDAISLYNNFDGAVIEGNRIQNVIQPAHYPFHTDAMQIMGGQHLLIRNNLIRNCTQAILIKDGSPASGVMIERNVIHDIDSFGMRIYDSEHARVFRNTVWGTQFGIFLDGDPRYPGTTTVILKNNVLDRINAFEDARIEAARNNVFRTYRPVGHPAFLGRPNFIASKHGNYEISRRRPGLGIARRAIPGAQRSDAKVVKLER